MYRKNKIPKGIVDKIKQRNKLNKEIEKWCNENLDMDGMCSLYADITRSKFGDEQGTKDCKENDLWQIAEWLEELKMLRELKAEHRKIGNIEGYNKGYNKAIDDFVEKIELKYLSVHPDDLYERYYPREICKQVKELAEQLKAGRE